MAELQSLIRKRGHIKGRLTTFRKFLDKLEHEIQGASQAEDPGDEDETDVKVEKEREVDASSQVGDVLTPLSDDNYFNKLFLELNARLIQAKELLTEFTFLHSDIIKLESEENLESRETEFQEFEDLFYVTMARAESLKNKGQMYVENDNSSVKESIRSHSSATSRSYQSKKIENESKSRSHLPKVDIKPKIEISKTEKSENNIQSSIEKSADHGAGTNDPSHNTYNDSKINTNQSINTNIVQHTTTSQTLGIAPNHVSLVKLPTLQMKTYNGEPESFLNFFESFKSLVHNNSSLDNVTRLLYLKSVLRIELSKIIDSLDITAANYTVALDLIEKRYKNVNFLIHSHIKSIVELPKILKENATLIRQLSDSLQAHLRALETLGQPISSWDSIILFLISEKLDYQSRKALEIELAKRDTIPSIVTLIDFLEGRGRLLEKLDKQFLPFPSNAKFKPSLKPQNSFAHVGNTGDSYYTCEMCNSSEHRIFSCIKFLNLPVDARIAEIKGLNRCTNCLRKGHEISTCRSGNCKTCNEKHSTLLHRDEIQTGVQGNSSEPVIQTTVSSQEHTYQNTTPLNFTEILPTAIILVLGNDGKRHKCTALLDSGSMRSYMTHSLCMKLKLPTTSVNIPISGISNSKIKVSHVIDATIESLATDFHTDLSFLILQNITADFPPLPPGMGNLAIPHGVKLANPDFDKYTKIDILLGVDIFWELLKQENPFKKDYPYLHNTRLGYVVSGQFYSQPRSPSTSLVSIHSYFSTADLSKQLTQFLEVESIETPKPKSLEEIQCEQHFVETTKRNESGQFIVSIPLNSNPSVLGESKQGAMKQFLSLERRLQSNKTLRTMYTDFMIEYRNLGHMKLVNQMGPNPDVEYFIPHHAVMKEESLTTKLRVVFNSSFPTTTGVSLNDIQLNGPVLQDDLFSILLRFRRFKYVITGDCSKMYRSIYIDQSQHSLQRIFWRDDPSKPLDIYELCTVTYGERASSFLAIRCLFELAKLCENDNPNIAQIIRHDMYCDDLLTSCNDLQEAIHICYTISRILQSGGFHLRKWNSNFPEILKPVQSFEIENCILQFGPNGDVKTLGLLYNSHSDKLFFIIKEFSQRPTKRTILSYISTIFDPLGLLAPCIILTKLFMQRLWLLQSDWDSLLPSDLEEEWRHLCHQILSLNSLKISRQTICDNYSTIEIHGFSDSSQLAYGTCAYIRSIAVDGQIHVNLLCSKTKVAPLKTLTIPKLELCAAVMMAKLVNKLRSTLNVSIDKIYCWVDSTIVLSWIKTKPHLLPIFMSNRVVDIQSLTDNIAEWRYIPTNLNLSDLLTRGVNAKELLNLSLWWNGPQFLTSNNRDWPNFLKCDTINAHTMSNAFEPCIQFGDFSSLRHISKVMAYCLRFIRNCRLPKSERQSSSLTFNERQRGILVLARLSQFECYSSEFEALSHGKPLDRKCKIANLNPFLDKKHDIIRVGGRLISSNFAFVKKHPVVLSSNHPFTRLIIEAEHIRLCHAGPRQVLSSIRDKFWPVKGMNLCKQVVSKCIPCYKTHPQPAQNLLGNLPVDRVSSNFPFFVVGTDYCGPFIIKDRPQRGWKPVKCYVCLFVCFSTKAIHLEPVTDLTTEAFILCLRRFTSRRGFPSKIYSDNGRNYLGAVSTLSDLAKFLVKNIDSLEASFANENVTWKFLPPYSPNMGGIWEAGVKCCKSHLKRVFADTKLTFEHFASVLVQIEAVLNSRPLTPISSDPNDPSPLTPSHFLIGRAATTVPDPDVTQIASNRLSLYQHLQSLVQGFWTRWSQEYISELQKRYKWKTARDNLEIGTLVMMKDDNLPPCKWSLGRVMDVLRGRDGLVRVVSLRTQNGITSRAISKICPFPIEPPKMEPSGNTV